MQELSLPSPSVASPTPLPLPHTRTATASPPPTPTGGRVETGRNARSILAVYVAIPCQVGASVVIKSLAGLFSYTYFTGHGHTQYRGQRYCPQASDGLMKEEWLKKREEAAAKKAALVFFFCCNGDFCCNDDESTIT